MTSIYGSTPWSRQAVIRLSRDETETFDGILAAIPRDHFLVVTCASRPGVWGAVLMRDGTYYRHSPAVAAVPIQYGTVAAACLAVLERAKERVA